MKSYQRSHPGIYEKPSPLLLLLLVALLCLSICLVLSFGNELQGTVASRRAGTAASVAHSTSLENIHGRRAAGWLALANVEWSAELTEQQ